MHSCSDLVYFSITAPIQFDNKQKQTTIYKNSAVLGWGNYMPQGTNVPLICILESPKYYIKNTYLL